MARIDTILDCTPNGIKDEPYTNADKEQSWVVGQDMTGEEMNGFCAHINFDGLGTKYQLSDLYNGGVAWSCNACFEMTGFDMVPGTAVNKSSDWEDGDSTGMYGNMVINIGIDGCNNGIELCKRIYDALCSFPTVYMNKPITGLSTHLVYLARNNATLYVFIVTTKDNINLTKYNPKTGVMEQLNRWAVRLNGKYIDDIEESSYSLEAEYIGPEILDGEEYDPQYVEVYLVNNITKERTKLNPNEYTIPDDKTVYKNKNTFLAKYVHTENGKSYELQDDYIVPVYYITDITIKYIGPPIFVNNDYDKNDVIITVFYSNNTNKILSINEFTVNSLTVQNKPFHTFYATCKYTNEQLPFNVPAIYIINYEAKYDGPPILIYEDYDPNNVSVYIEYNYPEYNKYLYYPDFNVDSTLVETKPTQIRNALLTGYEIDKIEFEVPTLYPINLTAIYTKEFLYIVQDYDKPDVDVYIEFNYPKYNRKLEIDEFETDRYTVDKHGINIYTATEKILKRNNLSTEFTILGVRKVLDIRAKYIGPPIPITKDFKSEDILVEIDTLDENNEYRITIQIKYSENIISINHLGKEYYFSDDYFLEGEQFTIKKTGDNIRTVKYIDPVLTWTGDIIVPGIPKVIEFETNYIGEIKLLYDTVSQSEVEAQVTLLYDIDTRETGISTIEPQDWYFVDNPIIDEINNGLFKTKYRYENLDSEIIVPFYAPYNYSRLRCWYEGDKIEIDSFFSKEDVVVLSVENRVNHDIIKRVPLMCLDFIDETQIHKNGWNYYRVKLKNETNNNIGIYAVPGFVLLDKQPPRDFKVIYIDTDNNEEKDYTEEFEKEMIIDDVLNISWNVFKHVSDNLMIYGMFILTAPRKTGLSDKYDEDWKVICKRDNTLKANIIKTYYEEDESWQNRKQYLSTKWWTVPLNREVE